MALSFGTTLQGAAQPSKASVWTVVGPGGGGTTIGPTISPHDSRVVIEHCDMTGGYITKNNGQSWRMFNLRSGIEVSAFDPMDPQVMYVASAGLWRSSDSGRNWEMVFPNPIKNTIEHQVGDHSDYSLTSDDSAYPGGSITAMAVTAGNQTSGRGAHQLDLAFRLKDGSAHIVSSIDGGSTWAPLTTLPGQVLLLSRDRDGLLALSGSAAYRIARDGSTVKLASLPSVMQWASAGRSGNSLWIYATGIDGAVYLSKDSGVHWPTITPKLKQTAGHFGAIATSALHPEISYVGFRDLQFSAGRANQFDGIAKSEDAGQSWRIVFKEATKIATNLQGSWIEQRASQDGESIFYDAPRSLGVAPNDPKIVYATDLFRTYRTLDGGTSWEEMNSKKVNGDRWTSRGLDVTTNYGVQFDPFDTKHLFMDNTDIGLFQSADQGQSWQSSSDGVPELWRNTTYWLALDPTQRGTMWGAFSGVHDLPRPKMWRSHDPSHFTGGVAVSTDGGHHWQPSSSGMPSDAITHILLDPSSPAGNRTLYACAFGRGVYKSTDSGRTWTNKSEGIEGNEPFAWRITLASDGTLYLVVARRGEKQDDLPAHAGALYRSTDKAEHWQRMPMPAGVNGPTGLEIDPRDAMHLYLTAWGQEGKSADRNGGVFASDDGGKTWRTLFTRSQHVYDLTIDTRHPNTLYICGFDAAAYRSTDRGMHWTRIEGYDFKWGHRVILDINDPSQIYITTYGGGVWHGPAAGVVGAQPTIVTQIPVASVAP